MVTVSFTPNLERHVECPTQAAPGGSGRAASGARGESWSVVSHHLPPVHAVAFVE